MEDVSRKQCKEERNILYTGRQRKGKISAAGQPGGLGYTFISSSPTAVHNSQGCMQQGIVGFPRALHLVTSEEA